MLVDGGLGSEDSDELGWILLTSRVPEICGEYMPDIVESPRTRTVTTYIYDSFNTRLELGIPDDIFSTTILLAVQNMIPTT